MIALAILVGWVVGLVWYTRAFAVAIAEGFYNEFPKSFSDTDRYMAAFLGFAAGLFWPVTAPVFHLRQLVRLVVVPPSEQAARDEQQREAQRVKDRRELAKLRALAREHGLPVEGLGDDGR